MRNVVNKNINDIILFNDNIGSVFHRYICYNAIINSVLTINASLLVDIQYSKLFSSKKEMYYNNNMK